MLMHDIEDRVANGGRMDCARARRAGEEGHIG